MRKKYKYYYSNKIIAIFWYKLYIYFNEVKSKIYYSIICLTSYFSLSFSTLKGTEKLFFSDF